MSIPQIVGLDFSGAEGDVAPATSFERFFDVGLHDVSIVGAEQYISPNGGDKDPNWATFSIKFSKPGFKETTAFIDIPLNKEGYEKYQGGSLTADPVKVAGGKRRALVEFIEALGVESVTKENLGKYLGLLFANPAKMVGLNIKIEMGHVWKKAYARYLPETKQYHLVDPDGAVLVTDGSPVVFGHHKDCEAAAAANDWKYSKFPRVLKYLKSENLNDFKKLSGTKTAAPIAGMEDE